MVKGEKRVNTSGQAKSAEAPTILKAEDLQYMCAQCGKGTTLSIRDQIRCAECGCRILFKKRSNRSKCNHPIYSDKLVVQFAAR
ncbi:DNA-directed RNA polymerase core subunit rpc10 [Entomophthora muscae]|uniref:DNA-directed RNA polymerase core subunit rpc10 n=1 Tax=Entomophthora muscae TaxID=34485 RepID=A0ACC2SUY9_9FUNG|nr:DNA-directed RNA polymerase core subunit rpc10 [Entomophthora muscae]